MATRRQQVGGMQEVFIEVKGRGMAGINGAAKAVTGMGGRVLHAFPPSVMVASVPADGSGRLAKVPSVAAVRADAFPASRSRGAERPMQFAMQAWNEHVSPKRLARSLADTKRGKAWSAGRLQPPDPPPNVLRRIRDLEARVMPRRALRAGVRGGPVMGIPVLVGRIAVGLVYVDSTASSFAITDTEKSKVLSETTEGLNMLSSLEPRANIQWYYDIKRPKLSLTQSAFPSSNQNAWEDTWRNAAMGAMGYAASINGMNQYIADIKSRFSAQWAYALFVTKYPKFWFAYYWGNHVVMDFGVDGWGIDNFSRVVAHETGHVFGCPDEYGSSGCNCTSLFGRYQVPNGNCETCASAFVPCLMCANTEAVCDYTRGHLGWNELAVQSRGTTTLKGTWTFDFDTGVQGPAGGADVWWRQVNSTVRYLTPQSGAMVAHMGKPNFDAVSLQTLKVLPYTATPINGSNNSSNKLTAGTVIAIKTGAGRYAKMKINTYGYNLGITWVTYK